MSEKFQADPARMNVAVGKIDALSALIIGMGDRFFDSLDDAEEILGRDEFGRAAGLQFRQQAVQIHEGVTALGQVTDSVPVMLRSQQRQAGKAQTDAADMITDFGVRQGEGVPRGGSAHGK